MTISERTPVLLAVSATPTRIALRIDSNPLGRAALAGKEIVSLVLEGSKFPGDVCTRLRRAAGEPIEYELRREGRRTTVAVTLNFSAEPVDVDCLDAREERAAADADDRAARTVRLARLYLAASREAEAIRQTYEDLRAAIDRRLTSELDRCRRKIEFLSGDDPKRTKGLESLARGYESIRKIISSSRLPE